MRTTSLKLFIWSTKESGPLLTEILLLSVLDTKNKKPTILLPNHAVILNKKSRELSEHSSSLEATLSNLLTKNQQE